MKILTMSNIKRVPSGKKSTEYSWLIKTSLVYAFGGECMHCNSNVAGKSAHFHHIDSTTKNNNISKLCYSYNSGMDIITEVNKCILLCSKCHNKLHKEYGKNVGVLETYQFIYSK